MIKSLIPAALALCLGSTALAQQAGYNPVTLDAPHHGREMLGAMWYPAAAGGRSFTFGENGVFYGVEVAEEVAVAEGTFPVVVLSHGMGGNIRSLAWLSSALAEKGAVVISVNHPNTTWGDFDLAKGMQQHWTRAQDMKLALDAVLSDPRFEGKIDKNRIMAAGFSYGGWSALSLSGVRSNHAGLLAACDARRTEMQYCNDVLSVPGGPAEADPALWDASYGDARITHVVAVEPALVWGLGKAELSGLVSNVSLISLGAGEARMLDTNFDESGLAEMLPEAEIDRIAPAMHYSALPLCKPMGAAILREEGDDPICSDPDGTDRAAVHRAIIARIVDDLGL